MIRDLESEGREVRRNIVRMIGVGKLGYLGCYSFIADIMSVLYFRKLLYDPKNPNWEGRDRFFLNKGQMALTRYAALAKCDYFTMEELDFVKQLGFMLQGDPYMHKVPGIEGNTRSIGQGLSIACSMAAGIKIDGKDSNVHCIVGDGDIAKRDIWESTMDAAYYKFDNLAAILGRNRLQTTSPIVECLNTNLLAEKKAFSWHVPEINYKLIENKVSGFTKIMEHSCEHEEELGFMEKFYKNEAQETALLKEEIHRMKTIKYKYYLTRLLNNNETLTPNEIDDINHSGLFRVDITNALIMVLLKIEIKSIDKYTVQESTNMLQMKCAETLNIHNINDVIELENGYIVAIISTDNTIKEKETLKRHIVALQQKTAQQYGLCFTAVISEPIYSISKLSEVHATLRQHLSYRYIYGTDAIITSELIEENIINTSLNYPFHDEWKLITQMKEQNYQKTEVCFESILKKIKRMNYNNAILSMVYLCNTICVTINEINRANFRTNSISMFDINPLKYTTMDELRTALLQQIEDSFFCYVSDLKHHQTVEAVKYIVQENYTDFNLNLSSISSILRVSPNYLNSLFRDMCGCSVWDYITDYRLNMAVRQLVGSKDSIKTIMTKVGIDNESTFYRCFKEKFSTTPKNFLANKMCEKPMQVYI